MPIRLRRPSLPPTLADALLRTPDPKADPPEAGSPAMPAVATADSVAPAPAIAITPDTPQPPFLSLPEAAEWLCVSRSTIKRLIAQGDLAAVRVGARRKIPASSLSAYVKKDILIPSEVMETISPDQQ